MPEILFTSDTHFGHGGVDEDGTRRGILKYHPRRGDSLEEMNEMLVANWNSVVGKSDEVYFLGDFAMGFLDESLKHFHRLNGKKKLGRGNHDGPKTLRLPWTDQFDYYEWKQKIDGVRYRAVLGHYPFLTWNGAHHGVWNLHGHSHGLLGPTTTTRMDIGVDTHPEMRPYHLDEIIAEMATRKYIPVDAHTAETNDAAY